MSKDRELIFDMTEAPEVLTYPAADNEPLQLGGVDPARIAKEIPFAGVLLKKDKDLAAMQRRMMR